MGHKLKATSVDIKGPGESVQATLHRDPLAGTYSIISTNANGASSILISNDTNSGIVKNWNWVDIVLETYSVDSCAQYSAGGTADFNDMTLIDINGQSVTPAFTMAPYINDAYP